MNKKYLVLAGLLAALAIGILVWIIYFKKLPDITPPPPVSEEPIKVFSYDSITGDPVAAEYLDVSDCNLSPKVMSVKIGSSFIAKNNSSNGVTLFFSRTLKPGPTTTPAAVYDLKANATQEIKIDFKDGEGRYTYDCLSRGKSGSGILSAIL